MSSKGSGNNGNDGVPEGYREVPPEDRAKANVFFDRGRTVAGTGNFEYAIEMFMQGLALDPDSIEAHQQLRDISMKRKASGGKAKGMLELMKLKRPTSDDKANMLNGEVALAYDPGNTSHMQTILQNAHRGGYWDTVLWIGPIMQKANADDKKPEFNKFIVLRDVYKSLHKWKLAADACNYALRLRPDDMELSTEVKNLGAMDTMSSAGYEKGGSFRDQILDKAKQDRLLISDKDFADGDAQLLIVANAEKEYKAEPNDPGKAVKLVEALEKTEQPENENRAIEILQDWFERTKQFRFRQRLGNINIKQMTRMERAKRAALSADPSNAALVKDYEEFRTEQLEFELKEFALAADAYPTESRLKFEVGRRLFGLKRYNDAIPIFQQSRMDPKYKVDSGLQLGLCFLETGFVDEAVDTLTTLTKEYSVQGDQKSKEIYYFLGRSLEQKSNKAEAVAAYSKVAQWDFNYRDVQARIKRLRS